MPAFNTPPPHRPNRDTMWPESFYNYDISELPVKADSAARVAWQRNHQEAGGWGTHLVFEVFGQDDWDAGEIAHGYFIDKLPDDIDPDDARVTYATAGAYANAHMPGKHIYFSGMRQQNATRTLFSSYQVAFFGDRHATLYSEPSRELFEAIGYNGVNPGVAHGQTFDLDDYEMPNGMTGSWKAGSNAVRIPGAPFLFTWADVQEAAAVDGDLGHAIGWLPVAYRNATQWPARANDGIEPANGMSGGECIRIKASVNPNTVIPNSHPYADELRVIVRTLQRYGAYLMDKAGRPNFFEASDPAWPAGFNGGELFDWSLFECVDTSSIATPSFTRTYPLEIGPNNLRIGVRQAVGSYNTKHEAPTGKPVGFLRLDPAWSQITSIPSNVENPAVLGAGRPVWTVLAPPAVAGAWAAVGAGTYDAALNTLFDALKANGRHTWLSIQADADDHVGETNTGTAANWRAMVRRVEARRVARAATNVTIVPFVTTDPWDGGTPADWLLAEDEFPVYGFSHYTAESDPADDDVWGDVLAWCATNDKHAALGALGAASSPSAGMIENWVEAAIDDDDVQALVWDDGGANTLSGGTLTAFHDALLDPRSYRGGFRRPSMGLIESIRVNGYEAPPPTGDPVAIMEATPLSGPAPLVVELDGSDSYDPQGRTLVGHEWDFGDGETGSGPVVIHEYAAPGSYEPTLTVRYTDDETPPPEPGEGTDMLLQIAAYDAPAHVKAKADVVCTGTNDHTTINNAIAMASGPLDNRLPGGSTAGQYVGVQLSEGHFRLLGPILIPSRGFVLRGFSYNTKVCKAVGTFVNAGRGSTPALIKIANTTAGSRSAAITIENMTLLGRAYSGGTSASSGTASGSPVKGIHLEVNDSVGAGATRTQFGMPTGVASGDNYSRIRNLFIYDVAGGIYWSSTDGNRVMGISDVSVAIIAAGTTGIEIAASDCNLIACKVITGNGANSTGIKVGGGNSVITATKVAYMTGAGSVGFNVTSSRCTLTAVEAQDNIVGIVVSGDLCRLDCRIDNQEPGFTRGLDLSGANGFQVRAMVQTRDPGSYGVGIRLPSGSNWGMIDATVDPTLGGGIAKPVSKGTGDSSVTLDSDMPSGIEGRILVRNAGTLRREL